MHRHRLVIAGRQRIDWLIDGVGQPELVVAGVELHTAAALPLQVRLDSLRQVGGDLFAVREDAAVQARAVVVQVGWIAVGGHIQAVVAHDDAVDDVQLPVDLAEVVDIVVVAHILRHLLGVRAGEEMQMGVDDFHGGRAPFLFWAHVVNKRLHSILCLGTKVNR